MKSVREYGFLVAFFILLSSQCFGAGSLCAHIFDPNKEWSDTVQVPDTHYRFSDYMKPKRWASLWQQISTVLSLNPKSVVEIGPGGGYFTFAVRQEGVKVETVDIDANMKPDIVGSVRDLPFDANSKDVVVAFQVLEHLPYEYFVSSVLEMGRVASDYVIISIPDVTPFKRELFQDGFRRPQTRFEEVRDENPVEHKWDGQHYWEVGKSGYGQQKIIKDLTEAGLEVVENFRAFDHPYHHFYVIKPQ